MLSDLTTTGNVVHMPFVHRVQFSPDGKWMASTDDHCVILWDAKDGTTVTEWTEPSNIRNSMFTPDSSHLVLCSVDRLALWDVLHPFNVSAETPLVRNEGRHNYATWSPDGALCAVYGGRQKGSPYYISCRHPLHDNNRGVVPL